MGFVLQNIFTTWRACLLVLLCFSGMFSGAETVLFSLSRHERARMKKSKNRLEVMAASLVDDPRSLLTSLLMGNMTCNIVIFVISTAAADAAGGDAAGQGDNQYPDGGWVVIAVLVGKCRR